ncbi:hypothetical protein [Pseudonocardia sp. WMMC193]|uniref:hypothetical protein n=1 Tax=Pseudonocardia sp. WMMC193 TaxID=2911965 RepID=UPI001F307092|nr:hypothetical protein [Pseudonocardia sp. WMMC193]MCF7547432.1 hypothetical protein [Pseudonocardia sp. WMMC193]
MTPAVAAASRIAARPAGDRLEVQSAGTQPGEKINALSADSLAEVGADRLLIRDDIAARLTGSYTEHHPGRSRGHPAIPHSNTCSNKA